MLFAVRLSDMTSAGVTCLLLVQDEGPSRDALEEMLVHEGFLVHAEQDGRSALARLEAGLQADVILLDLGTSGLAGQTFRTTLRTHAEWAEIPVVFLTGSPERAAPVHVEAVVPKPFVLAELLAHIRALVPDGDLGRVLVVEDDPDVREVVLEYFELMGVAAVGAENGRAALEVLGRGLIPSVVLTDLAMPDMDGVSLIRALRQSPAYARVPVVVASAMGSRGLAGLDVHAVFGRPVEVQRLVAELRTLAPSSNAA